MYDRTAFFYIAYEYNEKKVRKPLGFDEDTILIDKSSIYNMKGVPVDPDGVTEITIVYYNKDKKIDREICRFYPVFLIND